MTLLRCVSLLAVMTVSTGALAQICPAGNPRVAPDSRYSISEPMVGQQVVTDLATGLMWKRCIEGQSGAACGTGTASSHTWSAALTLANGATHAGFSDWRLPNREELLSLVETACAAPAINTVAFLGTSTGFVWSSTTYALEGSRAWLIDFTDGNLNATGKDLNVRVRLVRGGQSLDPFDSSLDTVPDAFSLAPQVGVPLSSLRTSNPITVAGLTTVTGIGVSGAAGSSYSINGGAFSSQPGAVANGEQVRVRHTSAATAGTATTTTLTIGGVSANFVSTTADPCTLFAFPYTLTANTPAELIQAITCANANATADIINLNGQTVTLTDSFDNYDGATGLPQFTTNITVQNGTITRSGANQFRFFSVGGASGSLTMRDMTLTNGGGAAYSGDGGFISVQTGRTLNIFRSTLSGAVVSGTQNGGAIGASGITTIANSTISGNQAGRAALSLANGPVTITNSVISGNVATNSVGGAALYLAGGTHTISNSTITGNHATSTGVDATGGILLDSPGGTLNLNNTIVWANSNGNNSAPQVINAGSAFTINVTRGLIEGGQFGALNSNPLFITPLVPSATPSTAGNFALSNSSPAIDAGNNANTPVDTFDANGNSNFTEDAPDFAGNPRRVNDTGVPDTGSGTAPIVDMGAYERQDSSIAPVVSVAPTSLAVSETGPTTDTFVVSITLAPPSNVTTQLTFDANTQVNTGSGFGASPQTVTLTPANALSGVTVSVRAVDDGIAEANPHGIVITTSVTSSSAPTYNWLAVSDVSVSITDNDTPGALITQSGGATVLSEAGLVDTYTLVLSSQPTATVNVAITFPASDLTVNGDSDGTFNTTFNTGNWNVPQMITIAAVNDRALEGDHSAMLSHAFSSADANYNGVTAVVDGGAASNTLNVSISDNESAVLSWLQTAATAIEGSNAATGVQLDITANPVGGTPTLEGALSYSATFAAGTASAADVGAASGALSFVNVSDLSSNAFSVPHLTDTLVEGSESYTFTLALGTVPAGMSLTVAPTPFTGTITDGNTATLALSGAATVGEALGSTPLTVTLALSGGAGTLGQAVSVPLNLVDGTATYAGGSGDYALIGPASSTTVNFAAGAAHGSTQVVAANIVNDARVEGTESFTASLGTASGPATVIGGAVTVTISDNDTASVAFQAATSTAPEGATPHAVNAVLTITANGTGTPELAVAVALVVNASPGSATSPADYTLSTSSIDFPVAAVNGLSRVINIAIVNDVISEPTEDFSLGFGTVTGPATTSGAHVVSITDNDTAVATQLNFGQPPTSSASGASITPAVTVRILDVGGTLVNSTANVTLAIGANPSAGALSGTATVAAVAGIATFSNLSINTAGAGYTLTASSGALIGAVSNVFNITSANTAPTITAAGALTRQAGSAATSSVIATVSDLESAAGTLVVTAPSVPGGLSVDGFVNAKGQVSANVAASCLATTGANTVGLSVTDGELASTANLTVTVGPNTAPSQGTYTNTTLTAGGGTTVTPTFAPADNGSISSLTVAVPGFTGSISVNPASGVVTFATAGPAAIYTVTITATDNCGAASTRAFQLTVNAPSGGDPTITPVAASRATGSPMYRSVIANVSDAAGAGSVLVTVNGGASATVDGVLLQAIQNNSGVISAAIRGGCSSPVSPPAVSFTLTASSTNGTNNASLPITITAGGNPTWCQWWSR